MTDPASKPPTLPPAGDDGGDAVDPDQLVSHISGLSVFGTSALSVVFHVALIGLTSIGFISLCVKHRTLHPKQVMARLAEEKEEAERAAARRARRQAGATRPATRAATRPKSPIEKKINEKSYKKPTPSKLELD